MEVSAVSTQTQAILTAKAAAPAPAENGESSDERPVNRGGNEPRGRALGVFRQELGFRLLERLGIDLSSRNDLYSAVRDVLDPTMLASEALSQLRRAGTENPDIAGEIAAGARDDVAAAAESTEELLADDSAPAVESAALSIRDGLDALDEYAALNQPSTASVLSAESTLSERSTIRIRTQEGDVVRLDLRNQESLYLSDTFASAGSNSASETVIEFSSDSRLRLTVNGALNDEELAAIRNVFEQADAIATEFFDGDFAQAFEAASALAYDAEQLARVNLRFRSEAVTRLEAVQLVEAPVDAAPVAPVVDAAAEAASGASNAPPPTIESVPVETVAAPERPPAVTTPAIESVPVETVAAPIAPTAPTAPTAPDVIDSGEAPALDGPLAELAGLTAALSDFFDRLSNFLRELAEGFEASEPAAAPAPAPTVRYHYSESFKLEILKSVISVSAPKGAEDRAEGAINLLDQLNAARSGEGQAESGEA